MMDGRIVVRVQFSRDRANEAERELEALAGRRAYSQGTDSSRLFDFSTQEQADLFAVNARVTIGVQRVEIG